MPTYDWRNQVIDGRMCYLPGGVPKDSIVTLGSVDVSMLWIFELKTGEHGYIKFYLICEDGGVVFNVDDIIKYQVKGEVLMYLESPPQPSMDATLRMQDRVLKTRDCKVTK